MFSLVPDASKVALFHLCRRTAEKSFLLIDCQVYSDHLSGLGASEVPRSRFLELLEDGLKHPDQNYTWQAGD